MSWLRRFDHQIKSSNNRLHQIKAENALICPKSGMFTNVLFDLSVIFSFSPLLAIMHQFLFDHHVNYAFWCEIKCAIKQFDAIWCFIRRTRKFYAQITSTFELDWFGFAFMYKWIKGNFKRRYDFLEGSLYSLSRCCIFLHVNF